MTELAYPRGRTVAVSIVLAGGLVGLPVAGCFGSSTPSQPGHDGGLPDVATGSLPDVGIIPPGDGGSCPAGWVEGAGGVCFVNLQGNWLPSADANTDAPETVAALGKVTATSVSVVQSHTGQDYQQCGCNAQHLNIPLGKAFPCATSTLEFEYTTTAMNEALDTPALDIRFCTGPCREVDGGGGPQFYDGPQYAGSPFAPVASNCAYEWENDAGTGSLNYFPASALIQTGQKNTIALGTYAAPTPGDSCTGSFDTIDVHLQVYNCAAAQTGTSTLSYLRIY